MSKLIAFYKGNNWKKYYYFLFSWPYPHALRTMSPLNWRELKAIYHSYDTVCIWVFKSRDDRNNFMNDTVGMKKEEREKHYSDNYG